MNPQSKRGLNRWLQAASNLYFLFLFGWFALYLLLGDGLGFLGLANAVSVYFFLPLPLFILLAVQRPSRGLVLSVVAAAALFAFHWGPLLLPKSDAQAQGQTTLRVMTFNVLGRAGSHMPILQAIQEENPDVLFLQEITPELSSVLSLELQELLPYQVLEPASRSRGLGVMSKLPLSELDVVLDGNWMGGPQILSMQWQGQEIALVNFHTIPTGNIWPRWVRRTFLWREADMQRLADFAAEQAQIGPLIVAGDANATRLNEAYKSIAAVLQDAWLEAGQGFGHTFPGPYEEGNSFAQISLFRLPHWLVSIDYIFHSHDLAAAHTWMGAYYGGSDHRAIVTELYLSPE